jgi:hypothetical protein
MRASTACSDRSPSRASCSWKPRDVAPTGCQAFVALMYSSTICFRSFMPVSSRRA